MKFSQRVAHLFAAARRGLAMPFSRPSSGTFLMNLGLNNLDTHPIQTKNDQLDNYVGWVYACVSTIGQDLRANPRAMWEKLGPRREQWREIPFSKLPPLFKKPNNKPNQNTWGKFIELRNLHKDITGEAWWHLLTARPGGVPSGMELIQPDQVQEPVFNADNTEITDWWVSPGGYASRRKIDARDLILDFYPNPRDPLRGASPIEAFALAHHMDIYVRAYGVKMIRDGASIGQYLKTDLDLDDTEAAAIESRLTRKFKTPGRFAVTSKGASIEHVPLPLRDLDMLRILRPSRDQILAIYKMPHSKLGLTEGAGDTNQKVADKAYQENSMLPRLMTFDEILNEIIIPRVFVESDNLFYESENPVEVDREWEFSKSERKLAAGTIKVNQFLQEIGDEDIGSDGEVFFVPQNVRVVKSLAELSENEAAEPPKQPKPEKEPEPPEAKEDEEIQESIDRIALAAVTISTRSQERERKSEEEIRQLRRAFAAETFLRNQDREERTFKSDLRSIFSKEQSEVKKSLHDNEKNLKALAEDWATVGMSMLDDAEVIQRWSTYAAHCDGVIIYLDAADQVWRRDWLDKAMRELTDEWNRAMAAAIKRSTKTGWSLLKREVAGAIDFKAFEQKATEFAKRVAAQKVVGIQSLSIKKVRDVIRVGVEKGQSVNEIAKNLDKLYDQFKGNRAETIARTETAMSVNYGKFQAAEESRRRLGMDIRRNWLATEDERTRETHWNGDSDRDPRNRDVDMQTPYVIGGVQLWHPGDSDGPPGEIINCRCTETYDDVSGR